MVPLYEHFGRGWSDTMDWSDVALYQMYDHESFGRGTVSTNNGFALGKKMMNVTIDMWYEDMFITIQPTELYDDPDLPHWWLDSVLGRYISGS